MAGSERTVVVTGDVTVDWMFIRGGDGDSSAIDFAEIWGAGIACRAVAHAGGAALLAEVLRGLPSSPPHPWTVIGPTVSRQAIASPAYDRLTRTYMSWAPFPRTHGERKQYAWRIAEFWGADNAVGPGSAAAARTPEQADLLVIEDDELGFRATPEAWPDLSSRNAPLGVLLKIAGSLGEGALLGRLLEQRPDDLTLLVSLTDMRKGGGEVGVPLSWEQTYEDVENCVRSGPLREAARVIVLVGTEGVVIVERDSESRLVFDPRRQEGDWKQDYPGMMMGYATCVTAGVAASMATGSHDLPEAVARGLAAARALHVDGYQPSVSRERMSLTFPLASVQSALTSPARDFANTHLEFTKAAERNILEKTVGRAALTEVAMQAAERGPEALPAGIPIETVGAWSSVDRGETESMRSMRNILSEYVEEYRRGRQLKRPLSVAVFGPPGAGKSFAVKQIAKALLPGQLRTLEFNLSQFRDEDELPAAFHKVRDAVLEQTLPLVFWDEFDTPLQGRPLGWLRHFLAPMQDGAFREEGEFHPLGPAIFVFAGGTCSTLQEFTESDDGPAAKEAKKPDFVSRLRGYVNVLGPNQLDVDDLAFPLRRALLLRALLSNKAPRMLKKKDGAKVLSIDPGVLRAFILAPRFLHGARSMESILDMSSLSGKLRFERSALPARHQLALHVDADAFLRLVHGE
jgi:hypothetical protein